MLTQLHVLAIAAVAVLGLCFTTVSAEEAETLDDAQKLFYNGRYEAAVDLAGRMQLVDGEDLAAYELRSSALHFQLREAIGPVTGKDKEKAFKACTTCPALLAAFLADTTRGQTIARERLKASPSDAELLFFLGKLDLNFVWLQLETLGKRTGWKEYWEARHSLDAALKQNPHHVRARVARGWIDYIVDTKTPFGVRWLLGGGSTKRALIAVREAVSATDAPHYAHVEAEFALWEMLVREKNMADAMPLARKLAGDFPENRRLIAFLAKP